MGVIASEEQSQQWWDFSIAMRDLKQILNVKTLMDNAQILFEGMQLMVSLISRRFCKCRAVVRLELAKGLHLPSGT